MDQPNHCLSWTRQIGRCRRSSLGNALGGLLTSLLLAGPAAAQTGPPLGEVTPAVLGDVPFSRMHALLEKTIFKVDVMTLDVCVDEPTAAAVGRFATTLKSTERDDSIARALIRAPAAVARIEFVRDISFGQFVNGIGEEQQKAVDAGLLAESVHRMIADSLPHWFSFLQDRDIHDGDLIFYAFDGDTMRTVFRDRDGVTFLDRSDRGRDRRTSVLATYVAPGSGFRQGLLQSLTTSASPVSDTWACDVPKPAARGPADR